MFPKNVRTAADSESVSTRTEDVKSADESDNDLSHPFFPKMSTIAEETISPDESESEVKETGNHFKDVDETSSADESNAQDLSGHMDLNAVLRVRIPF